MELDIQIREFDAKDMAFLYNSFIQCLQFSSNNPFPDDYEKYKPWQHENLKELMAHAKIKIACGAANQAEIFGYIIYQDDCIYMLYSKKWRDKAKTIYIRNLGIATALVNAAGIDVTKPIKAGNKTNASDSITGRWSNTYRHNIEFSYLDK